MQQFSAKSVGARMIILGYAFMVLILINAYIAVLSSQLTVTSINLNLNSLNDLTSKAVGIFEADEIAFKRFNLQYVVPLPWNNAEVRRARCSRSKAPTCSMDARPSARPRPSRRALPGVCAQDEASMLQKLRSREITALVLDKPFVEYQAAVSCDLYIVGETVLPVNLGFAFPPDTSMVSRHPHVHRVAGVGTPHNVR